MPSKKWILIAGALLVLVAGCAGKNSGASPLDGVIAEGNLWDNARFVMVDVPLDPQEVKKILPAGMLPSNPPMATLFIADYPKTSFTVPYKEAAILVHVRTALGRGVHCPWMVVDDDTALIYGRELLGYPKKLADIRFEENGDHISASVTRRGVKIISIEADRAAAQSAPPPVFQQLTFNAGGMGQHQIIQPVWLFRPSEVIHESFSAQVSLTLADSKFDPIARLVSGDPTGGRMVALDIPGSQFIMPVGFVGPRWFANTFVMRTK